MEVGVAGIMVIMEDITTTSLAHVPLIMEEEKGVPRRLHGALMLEDIMEEEVGQMEVMATMAGMMEVQDTILGIMEGGTMEVEGALETVNAQAHSNAVFCTMATSVPSHSIMDSVTMKCSLTKYIYNELFKMGTIFNFLSKILKWWEWRRFTRGFRWDGLVVGKWELLVGVIKFVLDL